jgi:carbonic anhydrase/acetyltransferase-like protein (isoleucine patch superfamily)
MSKTQSKTAHETVMLGLGQPLYLFLSTVYSILIYGLPLLFVAWTYSLLSGSQWRWLALILAPMTYAAMMAFVSGVLSLPHQRAIVPGTFPRDLNCRIYFHRRLYGTCWTALYYCKPVYALCLSVPILKWMVFRGFGYRGSLDFAIYPDTWVRDLPLLSFGKGAYLSNRATIGTNIALVNGSIMVDRITVGEGACVGHLAMLAPGVSVGKLAEVGVGCAIGIRSQIGQRASISPTSAIEHGVNIGEGAKVGSMSYIGSCTKVHDGLVLPAGSLIPGRRNLKTSQDVREFVSCSSRIHIAPSEEFATASNGISPIDQTTAQCRDLFWRGRLQYGFAISQAPNIGQANRASL